MITLYVNGKATPFPISSESYHEAKVGAVSTLVVETTSDKAIAFPLGTYCTWRGEKFSLYTPAEVVKVSEREYRYTLTLSGEGQQLALSKFKFIVANPEDVRLSFTLTGKPRFFLEQILRSLPAGFSIGACLEAEAQAISFKHEDCLSALSRVAEAFKTEWHITGKTLNLGKVVGNKANAVTLSYGKGKGLLSGLTASNDSEKSPVGKLFIQGTERNIDPTKYGAKSLHLPKGRTLAYEGRTYVVSADGQSLSVSGLSTDGRKEDSFDGTNIYPQRVGVVSSVVVTPDGNYDIVDKDNPVDYSQYRIAGEKATITFQTGRLAGRTFDIAQDKDVLKYDHATKRFQLVSVEEDGMKLPEPKVFYPSVGDKYAVFGVRLPDEYITKAETELLGASVRYFHEALQPKVTYKAELDGLYAQKNWGALAPKLAIGAYVRLVDTSLDIDDHVRITAIRTKLSQQYKPQITLSNEVQAPSLAVSLGTLEAEGVQQKEEVQAVRREVARSYQQAMSIADGIADEVRAGFGDSISPVTARTMQLMVGDKSLQFVFVASPTATGSVTHNVTWDESRGILHADRGYLRHMTLGINTLSADHKPSEYKTWTLPAYDYAVRTDQKTIHLYAKVERNGANGVFFATDTAKAMEAEAGYYYLYLGMLSQAPNRAFTPLYGFTEILPSQIRTERITSADGSTSINLNTGEIVSDKIKFRHPDGGEKPYPSDYLHKAIHEGTTDIQGGVVLSTLVGAKDTSGKIRSYISGKAGAPALAAGVKGLEEGNETYQTAIHHDGSADFGYFHIRHPQGQGAAGSHLYLENYRYRDSPDIENPYAVKIGDTHPDIKVISRGKLTEDVVVDLPEVKLTGLYGSDILYHRAPNAKEVEVIIQPQDLGRYVTASSKVDVRLTFIGRVRYGHSSKGFLAVSASPYPSYPAYSPEVRLSPAGGSCSFSGNVNPDGTLSFYLIFRGDYVDRESQLNVRADIRVTSDSRRDRGTYLTQSGFLVFHDAEHYINADRSRLPYVDAVSGAIRNAGNVMLEVAGGLRVKGAMDTSGILLGGRVSAGSASFEYKYGVRADGMTIRRTGRGTFLVTHNLGHTRYALFFMDAGRDSRSSAKYGNLTANSFEVYTHLLNAPYDVDFSFTIIGDNY
nr:MAG TPA: tail protein [Caudoviricetes sp.]